MNNVIRYNFMQLGIIQFINSYIVEPSDAEFQPLKLIVSSVAIFQLKQEFVSFPVIDDELHEVLLKDQFAAAK